MSAAAESSPARLVKAYNTLPVAVLSEDAHRPAGQEDVLFYSGVEAAAKIIVAGLIADSEFASAASTTFHRPCQMSSVPRHRNSSTLSDVERPAPQELLLRQVVVGAGEQRLEPPHRLGTGYVGAGATAPGLGHGKRL